MEAIFQILYILIIKKKSYQILGFSLDIYWTILPVTIDGRLEGNQKCAEEFPGTLIFVDSTEDENNQDFVTTFFLFESHKS